MDRISNISGWRHSLGVAVAALLLLSITVVSGGSLGLLTQAQFNEVEESWADYSGGSARKGEMISALRGFLGYGGIIHNFKNYVLRQDPIYLSETQRQLAQYQEVTQAFATLPLTDTEERGADHDPGHHGALSGAVGHGGTGGRAGLARAPDGSSRARR